MDSDNNTETSGFDEPASPKAKRQNTRGRPISEEGGNKLTSSFIVDFRPTKNPEITREDIYNHFVGRVESLVVSQEDWYSPSWHQTSKKFIIFLKTRTTLTQEEIDYNSRCRQRDKKKTPKMYKSDVEEFFKTINQWPDSVPMEERDETHRRHREFLYVTSPNSEKEGIHTASEADPDLLYNVHDKLLNRQWHDNQWAKALTDQGISEVKPTDPYLRKCMYMNFLSFFLF